MNSKRALIILGGGLTTQGKLNQQSKLRYDKAVQLHQQYDYLICSTGFSYSEKRKFPLTEAEVGKRYLCQQGIDHRKILLEEKSKDTLSNAFYCRKLYVDPLRIKNLAVVTSHFHIPRAKFVFSIVFPSNGYNITFIAASNPKLSPKSLQYLQKREKLITQFYKRYLRTTYKVRSGDLDSIEHYLKTSHLATCGKTDVLQQKLTQAVQTIHSES